MEKIKDTTKLLGWLTTLLNTITELSNLAKDFSLENELYYGVGLLSQLHWKSRWMGKVSGIGSSNSWKRT